MASGVLVSDEAKRCIDTIRIRHKNEDTQNRFKILFFKIAEGEIVVDHDSCVLMKDTDEHDSERDAYKLLKTRLPPDHCCYVVYDCCYETKETEKNELVFFMWVPENSPVREKMSYASSRDSLKQVLRVCGIKHDWQVNDSEDIIDEDIFMEKLGSDVVKLEKKDRKTRRAK